MNEIAEWITKEEKRVFKWQMLIRFIYLGFGLMLGYVIGQG